MDNKHHLWLKHTAIMNNDNEINAAMQKKKKNHYGTKKIFFMQHIFFNQ